MAVTRCSSGAYELGMSAAKEAGLVKIKPALTAGEWARTRGGRATGEAWRESAGVEFYVHDHANQPGLLVVGAFPGRSVSIEPVIFHALAAKCLHGQPFGFTREDVDNLDATMGPASPALHELARRIEALLPPEDV